MHPAHESHTGKKGNHYKNCPLCRSPLTREPRKRAYCSNPTCNWRGTAAKQEAKQEANA